MAKTDIRIVLRKDEPVTMLLALTTKALRGAGKDKLAEEFQQEACSGSKLFLTVVKEYVILEQE